MTTLDPARAALVLHEYRYATNENAAIKALFPNAQEIILDTNLDAAGGADMSAAIFAATSSYPMVFEQTIEGLLFAEDFIGGAPRFVLDYDRHPAANHGGQHVYSVISATPDFDAGTTTITVRRT